MIMKKDYLKPEIAEINLVVDSSILINSVIGTNPDITETPLSNKNRGEWGNVWGNK